MVPIAVTPSDSTVARWILVLCCLGALLCANPAQAAEDAAPEDLLQGTATELPSWLQAPDGYVYSSTNKPDPFRPFVRPVPSAAEGGFQPLVPSRPLTPLEQVEASQLRLVGILWTREHPKTVVAMVELPDGKGYLLRPGVAVGRNGGVVESITAREVIIEEQGLDYAGKPVTRKVILKLHPSQGDEHG